MPEIRVVPLGAGQDVGRSCILVSIGGKNVMLDCGMHMGYQDDRRFPDFSFVSGNGTLDEHLDCVIISHFHLDHCGSLPYMSEMVGYNGPIYMTHPTKAICPILLEDYRKVQVEFRGDTNFFTSQMIKECMKKTVAVNLHETVQVDESLSIKAYYAGHVLGAAMFEVRVGSESIVYTGDFNMTPDRHLGAAQITPGLKPDLLISESTYATTIRDSKRARERDFLKKVHDCVDKGGKVLIPVFALGRAQELCILLESYWDRMGLKVPIYFSQGLAEKATNYYRLFINWTNEKIKKTFVQRNMFEFKHIQPLDMSYVDQPGPMVLFSTPGMLHGGQSLRVFKRWAPDENNMIIMPGYCVAGTVGHKVINGAKKIDGEGGSKIDVRLSVEYMSFSAHADAKGIMQLIRTAQPRHVMFVHGEEAKMDFLKDKVTKEFDVKVFKPANGETVSIPTEPEIWLDVPRELIKRSMAMDPNPSKRRCPFHANLILEEGQLKVTDPQGAADALGLPMHTLSFSVKVPVKSKALKDVEPLDWLRKTLNENFPEAHQEEEGEELKLDGAVGLKIIGEPEKKVNVRVSWLYESDAFGSEVVETLKKAILS